MGWLFKKKDDVLDLTERYKKQQERLKAIKTEQESTTTTTGIGIFGMATPTPSVISSDTGSDEEKRKKLAKRLMAITDKIEDLSNQIYHLQQRVELLEQKSKVGY